MDCALIFTGGERPDSSVLTELPQADLVVTADSGYDHADALGIKVDVLVGDMDSISARSIPEHVIIEQHAADKDATDLELALALVGRDNPARVVVVGGGGGRLDHELATAELLCSSRWSIFEELDWISSRGTSHVVRGRRLLHGDTGATITLIPMGGDATAVSTKGLRWNLEDGTLRAGTTLGVSNVLRSPVVDIRVGNGCVLAVLPGVID